MDILHFISDISDRSRIYQREGWEEVIRKKFFHIDQPLDIFL